MASPTLSRSSSMPPLAPQRRRAASANRISIASMPSMDLSGRRRTIKPNDNSHIHTVPSSSSSSHSPSIPNSTNRSVRRDEMIHENMWVPFFFKCFAFIYLKFGVCVCMLLPFGVRNISTRIYWWWKIIIEMLEKKFFYFYRLESLCFDDLILLPCNQNSAQLGEARTRGS